MTRTRPSRRTSRGKVNLQDTPILEWSWKAVTLPTGGDVRHGATDDEVLQVYVDWPRFPEAVRSRIIGYVGHHGPGRHNREERKDRHGDLRRGPIRTGGSRAVADGAA